jgi:hypothetical protein
MPATVVVLQIKTMLEEVECRMTEARASTHEFKRAVIVGGEHPRTGATMADKFVKCAVLQLRYFATQVGHVYGIVRP